MTTNKKADPSTLFAESISAFTQSATKAFNDFQNQVRGDIARAESDTRQAHKERDQALKALQDSKKELQRYKDEIQECKANLKEAELTIKHHIENYARLQRDTNQWKDQAKNWQEHFLRVEQERCSLSSRMDELVTERLIPPTPKVSASKPPASANRSGQPQPPTYHPAPPVSNSQDLDVPRITPPIRRNPRSSGRSAKRSIPSQSELPPYSEVAGTPQSIKSTASSSAARKSVTAASSRANKVTTANTSSGSTIAVEPQEPKQIFIRRVRAVVEVKQEEASDEDLIEPPAAGSPDPVATLRRSHNPRRARRIVNDDDDYLPDDVSVENGSHVDADDDDDELMIGAGDDLSFDVNSSSATGRTPGSRASPNKKRKLNTNSVSKPKGKRKVVSQ